MKHNLRLVSFLSSDNVKLPGLLYEPEKPTNKAAIYLHGNGSASIFYGADKTNTLATTLNQNNITFFPFNNRGANYISSLHKYINGEDTRALYGYSYEIIKDCIYDIEGAIAFLKQHGYKEFYLIGSSTGANKIVLFDFYKPQNEVSKYILLSGGDDTGLYYKQFGQKKFMNVLKQAKKEILAGNGTKLVPSSIMDFFISWQSLYDTINPNGDYNIFPFNEYMNSLKLSDKELFREFKNINKPTFVVYGGHDEYCYENAAGCVEVLKNITRQNTNFTYHIIPEADHGFTDHEEELAQHISAWLTNS